MTNKQETEREIREKVFKAYLKRTQGKKVFDYDIFECPEELKGQLKIGDFYG